MWIKNRLGRCYEKEYQQNIEVSDIKEDAAFPSPKVIIYKSELDFISRCILDYPNIETGGELLGFWSNQGVPIVLYVIGGWAYVVYSSSSYDYTPVTETEVNTPTYDKYRCTAAFLNVRIHPNRPTAFLVLSVEVRRLRV